MTTTNFGRLTTNEKLVWSRDLWKAARNMAFIPKFLGDGPGAMIQHIKSLTKTEKGTKAIMTLVPDLEGDGVAGDRALKYNEEQIKAYDKSIQIDQLRNANKSEGRMADQKSIVRFRETSRDVLAYWLADRVDQLGFLTMSGVAYTYKNNGASRVGSDLSNLSFAADVAAPSTYRRLYWDSVNKQLDTSGATASVTAADTPTYDMLVLAKAYAKNNYIRGIREGGEETFHVFFSPLAMAKLKLDERYLKALQHAEKQGSSNPIFTGATVKIDGMYLHEHRHVYNTSGTATKWGAGSLIDGCQVLFCGAQAMGMADLGSPEWVEEDDDYGNQQAIAVGKIFGFLKPKFTTMYGLGAATEQDFGVMSIYCAQ